VSPAITARIRLAGLLVLALLLQTTVIPDLRVFGVCADLMLLCTICAGLVGGPELGGLVGFSAGLLADLFLTTTPFGLSALALSLVGYAVGSIRGTMLQEGWLLAPATALVASGAGVVTFVVAGVMVGQSQLTRLGPLGIAKTALLVGLMNAVIAGPACRVVGWAAAGSGRVSESSGEMSSLATRTTSRMTAGQFPGRSRGPGNRAARR